MNRTAFFYFLLILFLFFSCKNQKKSGSSGDADSELLYLDYQLTGEEGFDKLTLLALVRDGGPTGQGVLLKKPSGLKLDDEDFVVDSSAMDGVFYELYKTPEELKGEHSIVFTTIGENKYSNRFDFTPLTLLTPLPDTLRKEDILLELGGVDNIDEIRLLLTDTSFLGNGINRPDSVIDGKLLLKKEYLDKLAVGPVQLELVMEKETDLDESLAQGGRFYVYYTLRREFILVD